MRRGAVVRGQFRYSLTREWGTSPQVLWVMLNPSTADGTHDDATIRKCIGFTKRWGYSALEVVNLYAYRATSPRDLKAAGYLIGGTCADGVIVGACQRSRIAVLAWGNHAQAARAAYVMRLVRDSMDGGDGSVFCLGVTQTGQPRHPLLVPYSQQLVRPPLDVALPGESFPVAVPLAEVP